MTDIIYILLTLIASAGFYYITVNNGERVLYPDSERYFHAGAGNPVYNPFHMRWFVPFICKQNTKLWDIVTQGSLILIPTALYLYLRFLHVEELRSFIGALMVFGLSGIWKMNALSKYLVDTTAILSSLIASTFFINDNIAFGIFFTVLATCVKETSFVFIALFSWNPLPLGIGGFVYILESSIIEPAKSDLLGEDNHEILDHPLKTGLKWHKGNWFNIELMLLPWGVVGILGLIGAVSANIWQYVLVALAVSYGQVLLATDTVRLYQWSFPVMILSAVLFLPIEYSILALVIHYLNPWQKNYI